jgi:hypothetical protein
MLLGLLLKLTLLQLSHLIFYDLPLLNKTVPLGRIGRRKKIGHDIAEREFLHNFLRFLEADAVEIHWGLLFGKKTR